MASSVAGPSPRLEPWVGGCNAEDTPAAVLATHPESPVSIRG